MLVAYENYANIFNCVYEILYAFIYFFAVDKENFERSEKAVDKSTYFIDKNVLYFGSFMGWLMLVA